MYYDDVTIKEKRHHSNSYVPVFKMHVQVITCARKQKFVLALKHKKTNVFFCKNTKKVVYYDVITKNLCKFKKFKMETTNLQKFSFGAHSSNKLEGEDQSATPPPSPKIGCQNIQPKIYLSEYKVNSPIT